MVRHGRLPALAELRGMRALEAIVAGGPYATRTFDEVIAPLVAYLDEQRTGDPLIVGLQGGQGTGKSTLTATLAGVLAALGLEVVSFSIDDFYLSYADRRALSAANPANPFYQIPRGLPGTHRVGRLLDVLRDLRGRKPVRLPVFHKWLHDAWGDIATEERVVPAAPDLVLFEGWCLGMPEASPQELAGIAGRHGIDLAGLDPDLRASASVLERVREYQPLWDALDVLVMLRPDDKDLHKTWRFEKERAMRSQKGAGMSREQIDRYVDLYLPFTYLCYERAEPDVVISVNAGHELYRIAYRRA